MRDASKEQEKRIRTIARMAALVLTSLGLILLFVGVVDCAALPKSPDIENGRTHLLIGMGRGRTTNHYATDGDVAFITAMAMLGCLSVWAGAQILMKFDPGALLRVLKNR